MVELPESHQIWIWFLTYKQAQNFQLLNFEIHMYNVYIEDIFNYCNKSKHYNTWWNTQHSNDTLNFPC